MDEYMQRSDKKVFFAHGFPRNEENIDVWNELMGEKAHQKFTVLFEVKPEVLM